MPPFFWSFPLHLILSQVLSKDGLCKTYVYGLDIPVAAQWISLAVAPFEVFPDRYSGLLSYMCLPAYLQSCATLWDFSTAPSGLLLTDGNFPCFLGDCFRLYITILLPSASYFCCCFLEFLFSFNSHYEEYLSASFPFGSYTQVFIVPEMAISSTSSGASLTILSSQVLYDEKVIDQVYI